MTIGTPDRILVAGAGIGGLTAAIALKQAGMDVHVFERVAELRPVGAGITMQGNAMVALKHIGLDEAVMRQGAVMESGFLKRFDGAMLSPIRMEELRRLTSSAQVGIHRGSLHRILVDALGPERLHLGRACTGYDVSDTGVTLKMEDGRHESGGVLVGADGIHSAIRKQLLGDGEPLYAGYTAWRGVTDGPFPGAAKSGGETWGRGRRFGMISIDDGRVYWFATLNAPAHGQDVRGEVQQKLLQLYGNWHAPIPELIRATSESNIIRNDIIHRPPAQRWGEGRVTLLGDAAHAMTPNLGQGACQAMEDGVVLATCLKAAANPVDGLRAYERKRIPRANWFVSNALSLGVLGQWENSVACWMRDTLVRMTPSSATSKQFAKAWSFEP